MRILQQKARVLVCLLLLLIAFPVQVVLAQCPPGVQSCSSGYQVDQTFFGSGGQIEACSTQFCSKQSLGELSVGETNSANFRAYAGFNTTDAPYIEFVVTGANIDLGYISTSAASTGTGTFYVRAWQAGSYVVRTESDPPTNPQGGYQITPLSSPTASAPGTEQFGINLVDNSSPDVGAAAQQSPDATFSFGQAATGYNTVNQFKYVKSDVIAQAPSSTSVTIYTISYLYNISEVTPSGRYIFTHNLVATGTY